MVVSFGDTVSGAADLQVAILGFAFSGGCSAVFAPGLLSEWPTFRLVPGFLLSSLKLFNSSTL